ncbi:MAG: TdeIII family type II restriction endonuclease [Candidatus Heimdallarchaeota archaeon]|nr:TdeIII family type II restriction endonuclease [Candidatus Heimdallarchaeota archaeon]MCK4610423.1 TdeIII family type II restriction endonuclease [Candidatus Heimdallarchaeota archaeon]
MPILDSDSKEDIFKYLASLFEGKLQKFKDPKSWSEDKFRKESPLLASLIEPKEWIIPTFLHSFRTTLGQNCYENIARIIALQFYDEAENQKTIELEIKSKQLHKINQILDELFMPTRLKKDSGTARKPNWEKEVSEVLAIRDEETELANINSDLYMRKGRKEYFIEIKSAKPNKNESKVVKYNLLRLKAVSNGAFNTFFGIYDNPYGSRENYNHRYTMKIFDMRNSSAVIIGKEFWDFLGKEGIYEELLQIFQETGKFYLNQVDEFIKSFG